MEFDINRVYTSVNADEIKAGSKVVCANSKQGLINAVEANATTELKDVLPDCYANRFQAYFNEGLINYNLCYLISEPEEKKLKWTDLKLKDIIRKKSECEGRYRFATVTRIDTYPTPKHIAISGEWLTDEDLAEWEKVEE